MSTTIKVVNSMAEYNRELNEKIKKGLLDKPEKGLIITPETFSKVFSPERIKLLKKIHRNNITSIYHLAQELGKPYEVVFRNIKYLEGMGLVKLIQKNNRKVPLLRDEFSIDIFTSQSLEV